MKGFILLVFLAILLLVLFPLPVGPFAWGLAGLVALLYGINMLKQDLSDTPEPSVPMRMAKPTSVSRPVRVQPQAAAKPFTFNLPEKIPTDLKCPSCGASIGPTTRKCAYCGSILQPVIDLPDPVHLAGLQVGAGVRVRLPSGERDFRVQGRALIAELWQATRGPDVPWTFTGNLFAGFALSGTTQAYLLNWQNRFYLFDNGKPVDDQHIQRYFLPYARAFGQGDQMSKVEFDYEGRRWRVVDIGRSQVIFTEGEGLHVQRGAEARFIYAASGDRHLLVEDYRSGGAAQDILWMGFSLLEQDILY
jgi:rubredoxin